MSSRSSRLRRLAERDAITLYSVVRSNVADVWVVVLTRLKDGAVTPRVLHGDYGFWTAHTVGQDVGDVLEYLLSLAALSDRNYGGSRNGPHPPGEYPEMTEQELKRLLDDKYDEYMRAAGHS